MADDDPELAALSEQLTRIAAAPHSQIARLEAAFLLLAAHREPAQLFGALGRLVHAVLPSELERRNRAGHQDRGLGLNRHDDGSGWHVH